MLNEEDVFEYMDKHDLLTVGWIHVNLSQRIRTDTLRRIPTTDVL